MDMAVAALAGGAGVPAAVVSGAQCAGPLCQTKFGRRICQSAGSQEQGDLGY